jgi:hypothetical protein
MHIHGIEYDALTGTKTTYASEDGKMIVKTEQDVEPHLEYSKALQNAPGCAKQGIKDNFQHVCHIPNTVLMQMKTEHGFDAFRANADELVAFLRKHRTQYAYLFTTAGRV